MKKLYSFMNKNKKPIQEKFGLRDNQGNWVSDEEDIKRQLRLQWEKFLIPVIGQIQIGMTLLLI